MGFFSKIFGTDKQETASKKKSSKNQGHHAEGELLYHDKNGNPVPLSDVVPSWSIKGTSVIPCMPMLKDVFQYLKEEGKPFQHQDDETTEKNAVDPPASSRPNETQDDKASTGGVPPEEENPLIMAIEEYGGTEKLRQLLDQGLDPNSRNTVGATALWLATRNFFDDKVQLLLQKGANVHARNRRDNETPLMRAIQNGVGTAKELPVYLNILNRLVDATTDLALEDKFGRQVLAMAVYSGPLDTVMKLVNKGAEIDHKDCEGMTAFMWASININIEAMKYLISKGADINTQNVYGVTALQMAANLGDHTVIRVLMEEMGKGVDGRVI